MFQLYASRNDICNGKKRNVYVWVAVHKFKFRYDCAKLITLYRMNTEFRGSHNKRHTQIAIAKHTVT